MMPGFVSYESSESLQAKGVDCKSNGNEFQKMVGRSKSKMLWTKKKRRQLCDHEVAPRPRAIVSLHCLSQPACWRCLRRGQKKGILGDTMAVVRAR